MDKNLKLKGIIPVLITPLTLDEKVDEKGLRQLVRHILKQKVNAVVVCGSMGEFPALTPKERIKAIKIVKEEIDEDTLLIAGTGDTSLKKAINNSHDAQEAGADIALVVPPFYFPISQKDIISFYKELTAEIDLPVLIYNIPSCTKIQINLDVIKEISNEKKIIGIKDSSGDFIFFEHLVLQAREMENFCVLMGIDILIYAGFLIGADGAIVWSSNLAPKLPIELYKAIEAGNFKYAWEIQKKLIYLNDILSKKEIHSGLKASLKLLGICDQYTSKPFPTFSSQEIDELSENLKKAHILEI